MIHSFSKKLSKDDLLLEYIDTITNDMKMLEKVIEDKYNRNYIIKNLIYCENEISLKIRFCSAVIEYEKCKNTDKLSKGRKIISLFVHNGSMFQIKSLSERRRKQLLNNNLNSLVFAKYDILSELSRNDDVIKLVRTY